MNERKKGTSLTRFLGLLLFIFLLLTAAVYYVGQQRSGVASSEAELLSYVAQANNLSARARLALDGNKAEFDELLRVQRLMPSSDRLELVAAAAAVDDPSNVRRAWGHLQQGLEGLLASRDTVINNFDSSLRAAQKVPDLLTAFAELAALMSPQALRTFTPTLENVEAQLQSIASGLQRAPKSESQTDLLNNLHKSAQYVSQVVDGLSGDVPMSGVPSVGRGATGAQLEVIGAAVDQLNLDLLALIDASEQAVEARRAVTQIEGASTGLYTATSIVRNAVANRETPVWQAWWVPLAGLGGALLSALGFMLALRNKRAQPVAAAVDATVENGDKHQEAILRLLDEMGNLADGDLTVEATVTEDITGAIADSINYAIEALRELVSTIDGAAESVDSAARQTQAAANHLATASENQSRQVSSATDSITKMASSIEEVSQNADRSSEVARHSVEIAHKGGEAVRRTIDGMNTIRETIQDTSKRIKRLGESSQEIGNIVELINDIAEQTNILALNASIQASMAGEAGRGFAVVADEVQRLAERSTSATKQIEVLVKTIQSDTNEAVVSMERSTTDVVSGALLAENAGAALDEIEKVSNQIASLVQNISSSGRQQATAAADVTRNMGVLLEISAQTAENTGATSRSIGKLAEMASQLRHSVDGFTLPREDGLQEVDIEDEMLTELASEENEFIDTLIVQERDPVGH